MYGHTNRINSCCFRFRMPKNSLQPNLLKLLLRNLNNIKCERDMTIFIFGKEKGCYSIGRIIVPVFMIGQNVFLEVIENHISLLLSKNTIKKTNTCTDVANDQIIILNKINTN